MPDTRNGSQIAAIRGKHHRKNGGNFCPRAKRPASGANPAHEANRSVQGSAKSKQPTSPFAIRPGTTLRRSGPPPAAAKGAYVPRGTGAPTAVGPKRRRGGVVRFPVCWLAGTHPAQPGVVCDWPARWSHKPLLFPCVPQPPTRFGWSACGPGIPYV
jgi:hypothetical protein